MAQDSHTIFGGFLAPSSEAAGANLDQSQVTGLERFTCLIYCGSSYVPTE